MRALDFRDGDIVEVSPENYRDRFKPFTGVVDSRGGKDIFSWVYVRKFGTTRPGGWYPSQCRRIARPAHHPALPVPENITLGEN
jgi:hypothetical protein